MGLETGTFINDLVVTNPLGTDNKSLGDDHLRLIKNTVKNTFPGMAGAAWRVQNKIAAYTVIASDNMTVLDCTVALTLSLTAVATLGNKFYCIVFADGVDVILDPSGVETVNGSATVTVTNGSYGKLFCNGVKWFCELGVVGPAASTKYALSMFADTTGKVLQDGPALGTSGQVLTSGGAGAAPAFAAATGGGYTQEALVPLISGTSKDITIPAGVTSIILSIENIVNSATNDLELLLGDAGGIETAGYLATCWYDIQAGAPAMSTPIANFGLTFQYAATYSLTGVITLTRMDTTTNYWNLTSTLSNQTAGNTYFWGVGRKVLSAELTTLTLSWGGTDTFAGTTGQYGLSYL